MRPQESKKQQQAYAEQYNRIHCKQYKFRLNNKYESDLIEWLDSQPNKQGYIKQLIRDDIARHS